ncbi:MAG: hypothetical protein HYS25_02195 [Ignavibacteriales bacterium]|nr:hypothetical protein [Ignavibacteriales bacterium]
MALPHRAALIEFGDSHDELLYSQLKTLQFASIETHLIVNSKLEERLKIFTGKFFSKFFTPSKKFFHDLEIVRDIVVYLNEHNIHTVIVNSASGPLVRNFCLIANRGIEIIGIIHYADKLKQSINQRIISSRIKKYFVLNDYLIDANPHLSNYNIKSLYPVFFPPHKNIPVNKSANEIWICVPGKIDFLKRDYLGLIEQLDAININSRVKFILLGEAKNPDGEKVRKLLEEKNLSPHFVLFDEYVNWDTFLSYVNACNFIMPLLHPSVPRFNTYRNDQISGNFNLSFGLKIPLLLHESFKTKKDFQTTSLFYSLENLNEVLSAEINDAKKVTHLMDNIINNPKFSFEYQSKVYLDFIST